MLKFVDPSRMASPTSRMPNPQPVSRATIVRITDDTPSVKRLELEVDGAFRFAPGQWVDAFLPGVDMVGGFSICSVPADLPRMTLGVKRARHPPARWCHEEAAPGDQVLLRAGGAFHHSTRPGAGAGRDVQLEVPHARHLLLVAGGVGVNPLLSIARDFADAVAATPAPARADVPADAVRATALFSAPHPAEFPFAGDLIRLAEDLGVAGRLQVHRTLTARDRDAHPEWQGRWGRIDRHWLEEQVASSGSPDRTLAFLCGPPPMTEAVAADLARIGVPGDQVRFEKWW